MERRIIVEIRKVRCESLRPEMKIRCGQTAEILHRKEEMTSATFVPEKEWERKEGAEQEMGASPQLGQHYCSLAE